MIDESAMCVISAKRYENVDIRKQIENQLIEAVFGTSKTHGVTWSMQVSLDPDHFVRWTGMTYVKAARNAE